jgi:uncharacterized membrane protein YphA (DoxX/SURF4 family)
MLNTFPQLLTFSFFAPTLLRVFVALVFFGIAYMQYARRDELAQTRYIVVGRGAWIPRASVLAHAVLGLMLLLGYYTQVAALLGALASLKGLIWAKRYPHFFPLCRVDYLFVLVILLSLLLTGAGALAFDLRL